MDLPDEPITTAVVLEATTVSSHVILSKTSAEKVAEAGYGLTMLIVCVSLSVLGTLTLVVCVYCCCCAKRCCGDNGKDGGGKDFAQKQLAVQHSQLTRPNHLQKCGGSGSSRKDTWTQRLLCKCDLWGFGSWSKDSGAATSPGIEFRRADHNGLLLDPTIQRSQQQQQVSLLNYSDMSTLPMPAGSGRRQRNHSGSTAGRTRNPSSRHNSTSSRHSNYTVVNNGMEPRSKRRFYTLLLLRAFYHS